MIVRSPAWIIVAGAVLLQASGVLTTAGQALIGIDNGIKAVIDLKTIAAKILPPKKVAITKIKPVVVPSPKKMPTKAPKQ